MKNKEQLIKKFTGKLDNFKSKEERHFYDRMLRAYLKGQNYFNYGFTGAWPQLYPKQHKVELIYTRP